MKINKQRRCIETTIASVMEIIYINYLQFPCGPYKDRFSSITKVLYTTSGVEYYNTWWLYWRSILMLACCLSERGREQSGNYLVHKDHWPDLDRVKLKVIGNQSSRTRGGREVIGCQKVTLIELDLYTIASRSTRPLTRSLLHRFSIASRSLVFPTSTRKFLTCQKLSGRTLDRCRAR